MLLASFGGAAQAQFVFQVEGLFVAKLQTRNETDGGWPRFLRSTPLGVSLRVDEDRCQDAEATAEGDRPTLPEAIDADDTHKLRARRKAVTPVARPQVPEDDLA